LFENLVVSANISVVQTKTSGLDRGNSINGIGIGALRQPPDFNAQQYLSPTSGLHRSWRFPNPGPTAFTNNRGFDNPFYALNNDRYDQRFPQARSRNDANSAFGISHQRAWYPGGSAAWSFTKAVRLPEQIVNFGKVRVAYGESGQQPPLYATRDVFSTAAFAD